jgi:hypothetical protein
MYGSDQFFGCCPLDDMPSRQPPDLCDIVLTFVNRQDENLLVDNHA